MSNDVKITTIGANSDIVLVSVRGFLDTVVAYHLQERVEKLIEEGHCKFLVDLKHLEYISSAGVGLFSAIILDLQRQQGKALFINIPDTVYEVLHLTHLIEIFSIAENQEEALTLLENVESISKL